MKTKYVKPTTEAVLLEGGHLLSGSPEGIKATMSGYDAADTESGDGFSQE